MEEPVPPEPVRVRLEEPLQIQPTDRFRVEIVSPHPESQEQPAAGATGRAKGVRLPPWILHLSRLWWLRAISTSAALFILLVVAWGWYYLTATSEYAGRFADGSFTVTYPAYLAIDDSGEMDVTVTISSTRLAHSRPVSVVFLLVPLDQVQIRTDPEQSNRVDFGTMGNGEIKTRRVSFIPAKVEQGNTIPLSFLVAVGDRNPEYAGKPIHVKLISLFPAFKTIFASIAGLLIAFIPFLLTPFLTAMFETMGSEAVKRITPEE
jgi:hypothetical protein